MQLGCKKVKIVLRGLLGNMDGAYHCKGARRGT